jgi:hypothetical protein
MQRSSVAESAVKKQEFKGSPHPTPTPQTGESHRSIDLLKSVNINRRGPRRRRRLTLLQINSQHETVRVRGGRTGGADRQSDFSRIAPHHLVAEPALASLRTDVCRGTLSAASILRTVPRCHFRAWSRISITRAMLAITATVAATTPRCGSSTADRICIEYGTPT